MRNTLLAAAFCSVSLLMTPFVYTTVSAATPNPALLALTGANLPNGSVILRNRVDQTVAAVNSEGIIHNPDTHGNVYAQLGGRNSLSERVLLTPFNGNVLREIWFVATIFPNHAAAAQAFTYDSDFGDGCSAFGASITFNDLTAHCSYQDSSTSSPQTGIIIAATAGRVEFCLAAFVNSASHAAPARVIRDVTYVGTQLAARAYALFALGASTSSSTSTPIPHKHTAPPTVIARPTATSIPQPSSTASPASEPTSGTAGDPLPDHVPSLLASRTTYEVLKTHIIYDDGGKTTILGLVRNNSSKTVSMEAEAKVYNDGGVIADATDYLLNTNVGPNQTFPFLIQTDNVIPRSAKVVVKPVVSSASGDVAHLQLVRHNFGKDAAGIPILKGVLRNVDTYKAIDIGAALAFFGSDGSVLYVYEAYGLDGNSNNLEAGVQGYFHITPYTLPQGAVSYHIYPAGEGGFL